MGDIFIKVLYGPYEANGVIRHKIQKIYGLIKYLESKSYHFETQPTLHFNRLTIEMNDRVIYTSDIRYMRFNMPFDAEDVVCKRITDVIDLHVLTFAQSGNIAKFSNVSAGMRLQKLQHSISFDELSYLKAEGLARSIGEEEDLGESYSMDILDALRRWDRDGFFAQYAYDYGCYMQAPCEGSTRESSVEQSEETSTSSASCICLSVDPPSLYSVCYGPPTPYNTETSQKEAVEAESVCKGEEDENAFNMEEWRDYLGGVFGSKKSDGVVEGEGLDEDKYGSMYVTNDVESVNVEDSTYSKTTKEPMWLRSMDDVEEDIEEEGHSESLYALQESALGEFLEVLEEEVPIAIELDDRKSKRRRICEVYTGKGKCCRRKKN